MAYIRSLPDGWKTPLLTLIDIFSKHHVLIDKEQFIREHCNYGKHWFNVDEYKKQKSEAKALKRQQMIEKDQKKKVERHKRELFSKIEEAVTHANQASSGMLSSWSGDELIPPSSALAAIFPRRVGAMPDLSHLPAFGNVIIDYTLSSDLTTLQYQLQDLKGYIFVNCGTRKYCNFPGSVRLKDLAYRTFDLTRFHFAKRFTCWSGK